MKRFISYSAAALTLVILPLFFIRLLLHPSMPNLEYRMPGFPADMYGFSESERLHWASMGIQYLLNDAGPEFLGDLRFDDGKPVFIEREVSHMLDVKIVVRQVLQVFYVAMSLFLLLGIWAWRTHAMRDFLQGIARGGWFTLGLILILGVIASVSFWQFFAAFHGIFFKGDSWLFEYSDTLIRLYPIRFWQDVVLYILGGAALTGGLLGWFLGRRKA